MSSPTHLTSDIEDVFSFNFPDYIPASSDYVPASSGNTPSESSNNSYALVPIESPTLSLFHDDPYIKVMHAYDVIIPPQVPIPPPIIVPSFSMLSPMFNPQEFFLPEELLPPKKRGRDRSSSSTPVLPQELQMDKVLIRQVWTVTRNKIEEILNQLDELPLGRIVHMKYRIKYLKNGRVIIQRDFDNLETKFKEARAQIDKLQKNQMG
nr:hypothetical protein [Tanacetum cinerariifolium]